MGLLHENEDGLNWIVCSGNAIVVH